MYFLCYVLYILLIIFFYLFLVFLCSFAFLCKAHQIALPCLRAKDILGNTFEMLRLQLKV